MTEISFEAQLARDIAGYAHDPLGFVRYVFPWGEPDTELADKRGPRAWQQEILEEITKRLRAGGTVQEAIQIAIASGHGVGKSALVAWIILWGLSTHEDTRIICTANTESQLRSKTAPELAKWHRLALNASWFRLEGTVLHSTQRGHEKTWRAELIPWSEHRPEAFAGLHNQGKRIVLIFDEGSAIPAIIWEVAEGALTDADTEILWLAFGNPTRNSGRFRECFGRLAHRWHHRQIDSRTVEGTNKAQFDQWIQDYGEDSDFVRVRVKGEFPRAGTMQLIPSDIIAAAATATAETTPYDPLIMSIDVARFGDDESVIAFRRGRDARAIPWEHYRGLDTMQIAGRAAALAELHEPDAIFCDETGVGAGVVDRVRQLGYDVIGVNFGARSDAIAVEGELVADKGAECWCQARAWLKGGGVIPNEPELKAQLEAREYGYDVHNRIRLEKKDDLKKRGLASPDRADALAISFASPVAKRPPRVGRQARLIHEYDPLADRPNQ